MYYMATLKIKTFIVGALFFGINMQINANELIQPISIPLLDNALVFSNLTESIPAVLNYYTDSTEDQIIEFYNQSFGEATSQELKRNRLTLLYEKEEQYIRVIISQQNSQRQVDIILTNPNN